VRNLEVQSAKEQFLELGAFEAFSSEQGPLCYGAVYTLRPILALGGGNTFADLQNNCEVGKLDAYLAIVSQFFVPGGWGEFARPGFTSFCGTHCFLETSRMADAIDELETDPSE